MSDRKKTNKPQAELPEGMTTGYEFIPPISGKNDSSVVFVSSESPDRSAETALKEINANDKWKKAFKDASTEHTTPVPYNFLQALKSQEAEEALAKINANPDWKKLYDQQSGKPVAPPAMFVEAMERDALGIAELMKTNGGLQAPVPVPPPVPVALPPDTTASPFRNTAEKAAITDIMEKMLLLRHSQQKPEKLPHDADPGENLSAPRQPEGTQKPTPKGRAQE